MDILGDALSIGGNLLSGGLLGGLLRLIPMGLDLLQKKRDLDHEYRMAQLSADLSKQQGSQRLAEIGAVGDQSARVAEIAALQAATIAQGQLIKGDGWFAALINAINMTVRPAITYWWMTLYTGVKVALLVQFYRVADKDVWNAIVTLWTPNDATVLASIISFWFVDRAIMWHRNPR